MKINTLNTHSWYLLGTPAIIGLALGLVLYFILRLYVKQLALKTPWKGDELIFSIIASSVPLLGLLVGLLYGLPQAPLGPKLLLILQKSVGFAIIIAITYVFANITSGLILIGAGGKLGIASTSIFRVMAKMAVWAIGIAVMLRQVGIPIGPILAALGVVGLAVAIALQDTLSNLFAGIHIIMSRQVKIGNLIKLDSGTEGVVEDINWRNTTVRAPSNNLVVIPNNIISTTIVTNNALPEPETILIIPLVVRYGSDLKAVERIALEVANEILTTFEGGVTDSIPSIRFTSLVENVGFSVTLRTRDYHAQFIIKHEFLKRLHERYRMEAIEFPNAKAL